MVSSGKIFKQIQVEPAVVVKKCLNGLFFSLCKVELFEYKRFQNGKFVKAGGFELRAKSCRVFANQKPSSA